MNEVDWKALSHVASEQHRDDGVSFLTPHGVRDPDGEFIPLVVDAVSGREIAPRVFRRFWWENKSDRAMQRENVVLWSRYSPEDDVSHLGIGVVLDEAVRERWDRLALAGEVV